MVSSFKYIVYIVVFFSPGEMGNDSICLILSKGVETTRRICSGRYVWALKVQGKNNCPTPTPSTHG